MKTILGPNIAAAIAKTFCSYHMSLSIGCSIYSRVLNPVSKPIKKYVSHHIAKKLEIAKTGSDTMIE